MQQAYRPRRAIIHGEQSVQAALRQRTHRRGSAKFIAEGADIDVSMISRVKSGRQRMLPSLAKELGFVLAWVREEELNLADRIAGELQLPEIHKDERK